MSNLSDPLQMPPSPAASGRGAAFMAGVRAASRSPLIFVTLGTFVGIGALGHDFGFSLTWTVICTVVLWAGPAQVILMTMLFGGAALIEIAVAVGLSGVRLLPMIISLIPLMRTERTRARHLLLPAHFIAVALWVEGWRLLPGVPREQRITFINGVGTFFVSVAAICTVAGFHLAALLPMVLSAALLMLTPLAFLMSVAGNARTLADRLALGLGLILAPALAFYGVQFDILWSGLVGGTVAYAAQRLREALR